MWASDCRDRGRAPFFTDLAGRTGGEVEIFEGDIRVLTLKKITELHRIDMRNYYGPYPAQLTPSGGRLRYILHSFDLHRLLYIYIVMSNLNMLRKDLMVYHLLFYIF